MILKIALDDNPQTRPIAIMLGPEIRSPAAPETLEDKGSAA
jgi:hypothetical protein